MTNKSFSVVLYDANCIIYYCFEAQEKFRGKLHTLKCSLTDKVHTLTHKFIRDEKNIKTIRMVWREIFKKGIAEIVREVCLTPEFRRILGCPQYHGHVSYRMRLRLERKLERKIKRLSSKTWFKIDDFTPDPSLVSTVKNFYNSLLSHPKMVTHMERKKMRTPYPSMEDMSLLIYSSIIKAPLVTNDRDLTDFKSELEREDICFEIIKL